MDMDFLTDTIFSDLERSDFIGGIDNEALDFGQLENFMQVAAVVGSIGNEPSTNNNCNNHNQHHNTNNSLAATTTRTPTTITTNLPLQTATTTISAHVSVTSTPINALQHHQQTASHLPESPPDSGSEPPYSPLQDSGGGHGLSLAGRDTRYDNVGNGGALSAHDLQLTAQFVQQQQHHHQFGALPVQSDGIRVKHEGGLIINPSALLQAQQNPHQMQHTTQHQHQPHHQHHHNHEQQQQQFNLQQQHHMPLETHIDMTQQPTHLAGSQFPSLMHYDPPPYPSNPAGFQTSSDALANASLCSTILNDMTHVEVIGTHTPRSSAPSTPVHNTRKRKMSTQLDYVDYANIKSDPGLKMSPIRMATESTPKCAPHSTSPSCVQSEIALATPAHSSASISPALSTVNSNNDNSMDGNGQNGGGGSSTNGDGNGDPNALTPCIRFTPFQPQNWHKLCDQHLQDLSVVYYRVDADKGFNFSVSDDAFVCQKKNHFQITCHARLQADAKFVKTPSGIEKIKSFHLHFYGVKLEAPNQTIRVEQSQSDRSKKPFFPVPIDLQCHIVSKITVGRLHFSETTNNNMRKKGRPNPEQRYFQLVVALHVHTASGNYPVISQASERIIVRASNPGQFESDVDLCWQRGLTQDSIFHAGRVGINTDRPDESLVVHGNLKISGHIVQPSDSRAKQEIAELDTSVQLRNLQKIRIVRYRYEPEFAMHSGLKRNSGSDSEDIIDTGVIAQEVREVIPDAVQEGGSVVLPNGDVIENFLLVNKDRILMENIGGVKELCKLITGLSTRVDCLEHNTTQLQRAREFEQKYYRNNSSKMCSKGDGFSICSNRTLQIFIFVLVIVMAVCLAAVSTIYFVEHHRNQNNILRWEKLYFGQQQTSDLHFLHHHVNNNKTQHPNQSYAPFHDLGTAVAPQPPGDLPRNDDYEVFQDKPHLPPPLIAKHINRITTTAPTLRNKTISKNKSKYSEAVLPGARETAPTLQKQTLSVKAFQSLSSNNNTAASNRASAKPVDTVLLPQDFENNSIDGDTAQQLPRKSQLVAVGDNHIVAASAAEVSGSSAAGVVAIGLRKPVNKHERTLAFDDNANNAEEINIKVDEHLSSTLSSNNFVPVVLPATTTSTTTTTTSTVSNPSATAPARREPLIVYKTVSPPTVEHHLLTTNKVAIEGAGSGAGGVVLRNYSIETPPTANHSNGNAPANTLDNPDAIDLQVLSTTNETVDNPITALFGFSASLGAVRESSLGRRSTSGAHARAIENLTHQLRAFGEPLQCVGKQAANCQSACGAADLIEHVAAKQAQQQQQQSYHQQNVDAELNLASLDEEDVEEYQKSKPVLPAVAAILTSSSAAAEAKTYTDEEQQQQHEHEDQRRPQQEDDETSADTETLELEPLNVKRMLKIKDIVPKFESTRNADCTQVSATLMANTHNRTLQLEEYCPQLGQSMQVTYIIPISRYLLSETIELHLSYSKPLNWHLCKNNVLTENTNKKLLNTPTHQQQNSANVIQQRQGSKAILFVDIPQQGTFEREIILRAVNDTRVQNVCSDSSELTRLQYNFRILRDCD